MTKCGDWTNYTELNLLHTVSQRDAGNSPLSVSTDSLGFIHSAVNQTANTRHQHWRQDVMDIHLVSTGSTDRGFFENKAPLVSPPTASQEKGPLQMARLTISAHNRFSVTRISLKIKNWPNPIKKEEIRDLSS